MRNLRNSKGFTLIELLIVIVIIGILAGVLLSVLNPVQQQNKAKNGTIRATLDKLALSTKSLQAASFVGQVATRQEFTRGAGSIATSLTNTTLTCDGVTTADAGIAHCYFQISGIDLPTGTNRGCDTTGYRGTSTDSGNCDFLFVRDPNTNGFRIAAKLHGETNTMMYQYYESGNAIVEGFYNCTSGATLTGAVSSTPANCTVE